MRRIVAGAVACASLAAGAGCQTPVGHYLGERARDFGECFRLQIGTGYGIGVGARALGVVGGGLGLCVWPARTTIGFSYGEWYPKTDAADDEGEVELFHVFRMYEVGPVAGFKPSLLFNISPPHHPERAQISSGLFPALLTWRYARSPGRRTDEGVTGEARADPVFHWAKQARWLWFPPPATEATRHALSREWTHERLHAFDIEASAFFAAVGVKVGFSPGEFLDFVVGWFGGDLAGDDRRWTPPDGHGSTTGGARSRP